MKNQHGILKISFELKSGVEIPSGLKNYLGLYKKFKL